MPLKPKINSRISAFLVPLVLLSFGSAGASTQTDPMVADLVMLSGKILTVNVNFDVVEAIAIKDGKVLRVGTNAEIDAVSGSTTRRIDLRGKTVIPGFIDAHSHPTEYGMHIVWPDLSQAKSISEMLTIIKEEVESKQPGEWITNARIWNEEDLQEGRNPTRWDLDKVSPDNPVFLGRGHLGVANTAAFEALGISKDTPDPDGGTFERDDKTGELTGRLYETAMDRFRQAIPDLTLEQIMAAQTQSYDEMAAAGITSVRSAGYGAAIGSGGSGAIGSDELRGFLELRLREQLKLRTSVTIQVNPNQQKESLERFLRESPVASGLGDEMLKIWGVKLVADGGTDLAYLRKGYRNRPDFHGQLGGTYQTFLTTALLCRQYGWRVATHALGDAAVDFILDIYEAVNDEHSIVGKRWSIEHGYFLRPDHYARIRRLGLIVHPQTWHFYNIHKNFVSNYPEEYSQMTHPYRTLLKHEIPLAGGMDWHIENPSDVFFYLWVEISRRTEEGVVVGPEQRLSRQEALRFHTIWAARSTFEEDEKGSLEPGKYADLVVISKDYLTVPENEIRTITPLLTMVGGRIVFQQPNTTFLH